MRKKKLLNLSAIILGVLMCFSFSKVQAADSVFCDVELTRDNLKTIAEANTLEAEVTSKVLGISAKRESGNYYQWNVNTTGEGKTIWKIAAYPSTTSNTANYNDLYYCLNASRGFGIQNGDMAEGTKDIYSSIYDMKNTAHKSNISDLAGEDLGKNYNKILWILDHSYIPTKSSTYKETIEYKDLMKKAGIEVENKNWDLTEDDIEVVQQMAIWYFTNSNNANYHNSNLPSLYINGEQLSSIYYETTEYGEQITGAKRQEKADKLYKYFINNATSTYSSVEPTLSLNNTEAKVEENGNYFIAGPFELTGENTESIKSITANVNKTYTLLNSSKKLVDNNDFSKVIGNKFYLRFTKEDITESTQINLNIEYKYDVRTLTFMTDENDPTNTQPVVVVKTEERTKNTDIEIKLTTVKVEKVWDDNHNQDGVRPSQVKVALYQENTKKDEQILQESNSWSYTWNGLLAGNYSVKELNSEGNLINSNEKYNNDYTKVTYQVGVNENNIPLTVITNQHIPETTKVEGIKTWVDANNQDRKRPEKITINLLANGVKVDSKEVTGPKWEYSFENLVKYKNGREIVYTVDEEKVEGYKKTVNGYNITNEYTPGKVSKTVIKKWEDSGNEDDIQPRSIQVQLYKTIDGTKTSMGDDYKVILNKDNNWTYTWSNLAEKENGTNIIYSVEEVNVPQGYTAEYSANDYSSTDTITITNTHIVEEPTGKYNVVLKKVDNLGNELSGAKIKVNGKEYTVGKATLEKDVEITSTNSITLEYTLEETKAPEGYLKLATTKKVRIKLEIEKLDKAYKITRAYLVNADGEKIETDNEVNIRLENNTNTITINVVNKPIQKEFDLSLRKFITQVNNKTVNREPIVDTKTIATTGTATYKHSKQPVAVQKGDIVTYTIRAYNEGELDGYVNKITDYLPNYLIPIIEVEGADNSINKEKYASEIEFNAKYNWELSANNDNSISTTITKKDSTSGEMLYANRTESEDKLLLKAFNGGNTLDYIDIQIKCLVANTTDIITGQYLTNIAEITDAEDINGVHGDGNDSSINNVDKSNTTTYKNEEALTSNENSYITGQEDDDDFEKLQIQVYDLSLRKYITGVTRNKKAVSYGASREPTVDTTSLVNNTSTTANYAHKKDPVEVQKGDIVTYTIRVYNEGTLDGIPAEITEYIPSYLDFDPNDELNKQYGWTLVDGYDDNGVGVLKTNYLADTVLKAFTYKEGDTLDNTNKHGKDLKINFIVNEEPTVDTIMTNTSEISVYQYADKTAAIDRDSGEQWEIGILDYGKDLLSKELKENYVKTGKMTQEAANNLVIYVVDVFKDYKPDYTSKDYGISKYLDEIGFDANQFIQNLPEGVDSEIAQAAIQAIQGLDTNEEITSEYAQYIDMFFQRYKGIVDNKDDLSDSAFYYVGQEDDDDFEKLKLVYFDLALRKFITNVDGTEYNNRVPQVDTSKLGTIDEITGEKITTATYTHTKDPVILETGSIVTYTIRAYNEGQIAGYATEITDNIPEGLEFLPENETNTTYKWVMIDEQGNITQDVSKAVKITSNYLSEENDKTQIINGYQTENGNIMLDYKDVKVAFKVTEPNTSDRIVVNTAQISKDSDDDIDSIPDNNELAEDDIDREYVRVETFDLALEKWVTATKVTVDGKTKTTKTGFKPDSKEMAKVDLVASKLKKTTVKFVYSIRVTNEGQVAGYATEIKDYIPSGLKFVKEDNPEWSLQKDGTVTTDKLKDTLLEPGQSATVEITLTWKNSSTNMGVKTNWAEISADSGDDIDSTPNNNNKQEDDIDDASVILSIKTGSVQMYIALIFMSVAILGGGTFAIKKYVMNK